MSHNALILANSLMSFDRCMHLWNLHSAKDHFYHPRNFPHVPLPFITTWQPQTNTDRPASYAWSFLAFPVNGLIHYAPFSLWLFTKA